MQYTKAELSKIPPAKLKAVCKELEEIKTRLEQQQEAERLPVVAYWGQTIAN